LPAADSPAAAATEGGAAENFDGFADGTTDLGDGSTIACNLDAAGFAVGQASVQGGELRLTEDDVNSQRASFRIPAIANSSQGWTATFDFTIFDAAGDNPPADGFSFNYGDILPLSTQAAGETGHGNAEAGMGGTFIAFAVDTWQGGGQGLNIHGATGVNRIDGDVLTDGGSVTGTASITWNPETTSFTTTGLGTDATFSDIPHTFAGNDSYGFSFSARTGGANEELRIDNLRIASSTQQDGLRIISIEKVLGDVTLTWTSSDRRTYGVFTSSDLQGEWEELDDSVPGAAGMTTTTFTDVGVPNRAVRRFYQVRETP
jgi:hypothetical protein